MLAHLQVTTPPTRWREADTALKQAAQNSITFHSGRIKAIDAHDGKLFDRAVSLWALPAEQLYCSALIPIRADLWKAGTPLASLEDIQPLSPGDCAPPD